MAHQHPSPSAFAERDSEAGLVISKIGSSNNIERISGIKALPKLRILSLSRNQIKKLDGIEDAADTLEELWLSYNRIEKLSGLLRLSHLRVLRRSRKAPDALVQPGAPRELSGGGSRQVLYLSNNLLSSWGEVAPLRVLSMHLSRIRGCLSIRWSCGPVSGIAHSGRFRQALKLLSEALLLGNPLVEAAGSYYRAQADASSNRKSQCAVLKKSEPCLSRRSVDTSQLSRSWMASLSSRRSVRPGWTSSSHLNWCKGPPSPIS